MNLQLSQVISFVALIVSALSLLISFAPNELRCSIGLPAESCSHCVSVNSQNGWRKFELYDSYKKVKTTNGDWSVDHEDYSRVDASGHTQVEEDKLKPHEDLKYDSQFPFGALLINFDDPQSVHDPQLVKVGKPFPNSVNSLYLRINDSDRALEDNKGSIDVCFSK